MVLTGYSGGYHPLAYALSVGGASERVRGVLLQREGSPPPGLDAISSLRELAALL